MNICMGWFIGKFLLKKQKISAETHYVDGEDLRQLRHIYIRISLLLCVCIYSQRSFQDKILNV
jgi:hypothetical protein